MTKNQYIEFLIHSPVNYTNTTLADHVNGMSHDVVSDFLSHSRSTARNIWELSRTLITNIEDAYLIADDSVQNKQYSEKIALVKLQYSGAEHGLVRGIGIVNLVHSDGERYCPIDYRIFAPDQDGKTKNDHFHDMLIVAKHEKNIKANTVLMDSWYASVSNLKLIHRMNMTFYTTLKENRLVSLTKKGGYIHLNDIILTTKTRTTGLWVKLKELPFKVRLFKLVAPNGDIDWVITNCPDRITTSDDVASTNAIRWKIEQFHREVKNLTGSEKCQCRKARSQRNHIAYAYHAWMSLQVIATQTKQTIYAVKTALLDTYLATVLDKP
ncbi:MAG TPA: transposase, partial [Patescibacteria group bacterium]|nr:transposase [Patescibacteria group bacterium]